MECFYCKKSAQAVAPWCGREEKIFLCKEHFEMRMEEQAKLEREVERICPTPHFLWNDMTQTKVIWEGEDKPEWYYE